MYLESDVSAALKAAAAAQGVSASAWLEEAILLMAAVCGTPAPASAAALVWVRLRSAGHVAAGNQVRAFAFAPAEAREPLTDEVEALLTPEEKNRLGL